MDTDREVAMGKVQAGRFTDGADGEVTVFLIGMRLNRPWRVRSWWPVFVAMPRMLRHLRLNPEVGMLGQKTWLGRTTIMLSYWQSPEHLQRFASDADAPHLAPWREFQRRVAADTSVGIYHETYVVQPGRRETVYADMPAFGLGAATVTVPVGVGTQTAKRRMARDR